MWTWFVALNCKLQRICLSHLSELNFPLSPPSPLFIDNTSIITMTYLEIKSQIDLHHMAR